MVFLVRRFTYDTSFASMDGDVKGMIGVVDGCCSGWCNAQCSTQGFAVHGL